jgi:nucleoid-associated protein YgaU
MTRETKIGLLVGLAFIIVIGILLSDHVRSEPPQASLVGTGSTVRDTVISPGTQTPPITMVAENPTPHQPVPLPGEVTPPPSPVVPGRNSNPTPAGSNGGNNPGNLATNTGGTAGAGNGSVPQPTPLTNNGNGAGGAGAPNDDTLTNIARQQGVDLVRINPDGSRTLITGNTAVPAPTFSTYTAEAGDTVSRMAAKFLGANNKANRQAIIDANASLKDNPDKVIVGQAYMIPDHTNVSVATAGTPTPAAPATPATPAAPSPDAGEYFYTVKSGDSLWKIANNELGDPSAVDAIKELNTSVLKGKEVVQPGMKLRLPAKPVASAN